MRLNQLKAILKTAVGGATVLLLAAGMARAQVNLTAGPTSITLPDGSSVPMWGYTCGSVTGPATCAKAHPTAAGWSPVIITVPSGQNLQINLTNNLVFGPNKIPTSLVIVGQVGGGLGSGGTTVASPPHDPQQTSWPIADPTATNTPPPQPDRVQSFSTEVAGGASAPLTWTAPSPGTYLLESGTHPSIQASMGLIGMVIVTAAPVSGGVGTAYPGVTYNGDVPLIFSEIDPLQNRTVSAAVNTSGFSETKVWSGQPGACGNPGSATYLTCYPPVVNYTPLYYLINGVAFDRTNTANSQFPVSPATLTGSVLVRMVNAGSRMHVPSIVGSTTGSGNTGGFSLIAEDGNPLPGVPRVQSEVFMAAGKTYDVKINAPPAGGTALAVFDRQLSLSANSSNRDSGMLAYISANGAALPAITAGAPTANPDTYNSAIAGQSFTVSDPTKGVIQNDSNIFGVTVTTPPTKGTLSLNLDGTFTYLANASFSGSDTFQYCGNGATSGAACTTVTLGAAVLESSGGIGCPANLNYTSNFANKLKISAPGVLSACTDSLKYPVTVSQQTGKEPSPSTDLTISVDANGAFTASVPHPGAYTFTFYPQNSQGVVGSTATTVTLNFPPPSGLHVTVLDGSDKTTTIPDYRWVIEEDRTFFVDPKCAKNPTPAGCPGSSTGIVPNFGTNFHTSYMPLIATGCTGDVSCGAQQTVLGQPAPQEVPSSPSDVALCTASTPAGTSCLDPNKRYYISVLPGDAAQPFMAGYAGPPDCSLAGVAAGSCGHGMGGAPIAKGPHDSTQSILILTEPSPYPPATLTVFVFEDDYPLNGEHDAGGGIDVLSPNEPGLGGFQITMADDAGGTGDATGLPTYDMFNMPLSNSLAGTIDPVTKFDACPLSQQVSKTSQGGDNSQNGIVGMIITCPKYESDGKTLSPLAGQAVVKNLWQGRYGVIANPGADRLAAGEEWLQTNTLDGQKAHDSFMRIGEPGYFQEFGPAGYHVTIGFANPKIISDRGAALCKATGADCNHEVKGHVTTARMSRTPDERLYGSGTHDSYSFTQCYVSLGDPDGADIEFTKCDADGNFDFPKVPAGNWKISTFDQWNDQVVDGITTPVGMCDPGKTTNCKSLVDMGEVAVHQWQADLYTRSFLDTDYSGVSTDAKPGLSLVSTNVRFRDGSYSNFNSTDLNGYATFNEVFPLFKWYVVETDSTRYKNTGTHVIYDAGGPVDGSTPGNPGVDCSTVTSGDPSSSKPCGKSQTGQNLANTYEPNPLPADLSIPGSVYCSEGADCDSSSIANGPKPSSPSNHSTGRIDPAWVNSYGWQGFAGQNSFLEFGKKPFAEGENGGIHGHVIYASTRPFDDPQLLLQLSWEPMIPHVKINLYKEDVAADGRQTLSLVDKTETSSFDDWAQGFRPDGIPFMNCPGQGTDTSEMKDPYFWFAVKDQPQWLDLYNNGGTPSHPLPHDSQFKCYDGMHNWNQLQPAPYDGMYSFPSVIALDANGKPAGTNCSACTTNPDSSDPYRFGTPMLPDGKYVVEVVIPPGYELVKEEDKNILIGDNYIAPPTQQFGGLGSIFIMPDQAEIASSYNANNALDSTTSQGRISNLPSHEGDTGSDESFWPCVGEERIVPDYISLFPGSAEVAPFAGAKRHLCDRKEVTLTDQTAALAKFYLFTSTHTAAHFTGIITDDFTAEFDPFSPQFGEKFAPAYLPVSFKDWAGNEVTRVYADAWGEYNGLNYSTWEVNPPNPTGYGPTMMVSCMNDAGPIPDGKGGMIPDPMFQGGYSQFCYELPFMPSQTGYFDTPVVPTSAFAGGYNTPDCSYPDATPAVKLVAGDVSGPWLAGVKGTVTNVSVTTGGTYSATAPTVTFAAAPVGGTRATGTAVISGKVVSVTITNQGHNYTTAHPPTVTFSGGGGSGAAGTAIVSNLGRVTGVTITNQGSGYTSAPTVTFSAPPGGGFFNLARGNAVISTTVVAVTITNPGAGYTSAPSVTFSGAGGAAATASLYSGAGQLVITALGDDSVDNYTYSGPSAKSAPFNQQKVTRHFGFGAQCTVPDGSATCKTTSSVTIGGVPAQIASWSDTSITVNVPGGVPACTVQQQAQYGGSFAQCGQLVITAGNGKQSIDTVSVTVGGKAPTMMTAGQTIQSAIDTAKPGDLIIVPPGTYNEMLLMWKPVRLQGVGAASSIIDANPHPAGKLDPWRRQLVCLFGLAMNGIPISASNPYDPSSSFSCSSDMKFSVDRLPLEATVGWDATLNGNLAEQLIEPTLMGAFEGAGITVLAKGVKFPSGSNPFASDIFPTGTLLLTAGDCGPSAGTNPYPGNFLCNPSRIDGLTVKDSSQGGGGIMVHAWGHKIEISNNRVLNNQGTLSGGITIGQGEHPDAYIAGGAGVNTVPGSCITNENGLAANTALPYCYDMDVNVHNNAVTQNSSLGDELFSSTPAGAGGVTFCNGSDYYKFNYNWICGNMSTGDGAGAAHIGLSYDGDIEHNTILFNQSTNPTIVTNAGGLLVMGAPDIDPPCSILTDQDCVSAPGTISPSAGTGPGLVINANMILGNSADSGSGGGLRLQHINGNEVLNFPKGDATTAWPVIPGHPSQPAFQTRTPWNAVSITNNIIANNVAGIDGGGISLLDALAVDVINNTVVSNNSTASSGVLLQTLFAPLASTQGTNCYTSNGQGGQSCPQVAGLVSVDNSAVLDANMAQLPGGGTNRITCPTNHGTRSALSTSNCTKFSIPALYNDLFWKNRSTVIGVGGLGAGLGNQQNVVNILNAGFGAAATSLAAQTGTGSCDTSGDSYWDLGARGDTAPGNHSLGGTLSPFYSVLTSTTEGGNGTNNAAATTSTVGSIYCNGSRLPMEAIVEGGAYGWLVPPGTNESNALPGPLFNLMPAATVDEGNNWINLMWGPLSLNYTDPATGNPVYALNATPGAPAVDHVPSGTTQYTNAPSDDFYGNPRKTNGNPVDVGAIELPPPAAPTLTSISPNTGIRGTSVAVTLTGTNLAGATINAGTGITVSGTTVNGAGTSVTATFAIAAGATVGARSITVTTPGGTTGGVTFTVQAPPAPTITSISPTSGARDTSVNVTITGTNFTTATGVTVSGTTLLLPQVPVSNFVVVNGTTITATFTINSFADVGAHTVTVTTAGGTATVTFTVTNAGAPTLASISPTSHTRGVGIFPSVFTVTLTGTNFVAGSTVNLSGSTAGIIRLPAIASANGTTLTQSWSFFSNAVASTTPRTVSVTTPSGTTSTVNFTIQ